MTKTIAVCQARMASTRLPGKVLKWIGPWTCLDHVVDAANTLGVDEVVVATSTEKADDIIVEHCVKRRILHYRGSESDVISRYLGVANAFGADILVRLTSDCPFLDRDVISQVIKLRDLTGAHYASNIDPATYPDGLDCEVFLVDTLRIIDKEAKRAVDRDCVTTLIRNNKSRFKTENLVNPLPGMAKERWVLDSPEDLEFCQKVGARIRTWPPTMLEIMQILDDEPELREINGHLKRNERYYEALAKEPIGRRSYVRTNVCYHRANSSIPLAAQTFSKSHVQYPTESPLFCTHGDGGYLYDVDGNDYVDLVSGLLPVVLGYRDPDVDAAIRRQLDRGISLSLSTTLEADLAEKLISIIPCAEMVRFGKNGSDVTTAAVRLARAFTGRPAIISMGYHGWHDWALHKDKVRGRGLDASQTWTYNYGDDSNAFVAMLRCKDIAAVIVEPETNPNYLKWLREHCTANGVLLIFDEVITGFRYALGGAQELFKVTPDLACFGKAMANGMPISAVVGRRDIMKLCEPPNNIFYSGTFFGETLSIAAAIATIEKMEREGVISHLWWIGREVERVARVAMADIFPDMCSITGYEPLTRLKFGNEKLKTLFIQEMIRMGVLIIASNNVNFAHGKSELIRIEKAYDHTFSVIKQALRERNIEKYIEGEVIAKTAAIR